MTVNNPAPNHKAIVQKQEIGTEILRNLQNSY